MWTEVEERAGENEIVLMEAERDSREEIPCSLTPTPFFSRCVLSVVSHSAAVRSQQAASDANISSPPLSSEKDLLLHLCGDASSLHQNLFHSFLSSVPALVKVEAC